jgi:hypothetical protein
LLDDFTGQKDVGLLAGVVYVYQEVLNGKSKAVWVRINDSSSGFIPRFIISSAFLCRNIGKRRIAAKFTNASS